MPIISAVELEHTSLPSQVLPQTTSKIMHISMADKSELNKDGYMSRAFLAKLLEKVSKDFSQPAFEGNLDIKRLSEELKGAPWKTSQLFLVRTSKASFIIKGMKEPKEEINNLVRRANLLSLIKYWYPNTHYQYPQCIFPIAYISYTDQNNQKHYLSIMPAALGISLDKLLEGFAENPDDSSLINTVAKAYFDVGAAMARLYRDQNPQITHGDFHHGNVFYEPQTCRVTLIDNERIAENSKQGISEDIAFLLMKSLYVVQWTKPEVLKKLPIKEWYSLYLPSFISGYLSIFDHQDKLKMYNFLESSIVNYVDPETGLAWYHDTSILGFSHKHYMEQIFKLLKSSISKESIQIK